ncbi:hypothetical protein Nepgr_029303 [Nepenthes gracilis]|uniref:Ribosomal protein L39 n=1 Tax=Nepenthes gracilis TaxID=150966 RepID=A0AAD3TDC4_NEPGR|nr:hypothetical protein Nepgr_029303 [Nepenthes gracilis]
MAQIVGLGRLLSQLSFPPLSFHHPLRSSEAESEMKKFRIKKKLAKNMRQNRPIPYWTRLRTGNTIRKQSSETEKRSALVAVLGCDWPPLISSSAFKQGKSRMWNASNVWREVQMTKKRLAIRASCDLV